MDNALEKIRVAFSLGRAYEAAQGKNVEEVQKHIQSAMDLLLEGDGNVRGWDIKGRPLP